MLAGRARLMAAAAALAAGAVPAAAQHPSPTPLGMPRPVPAAPPAEAPAYDPCPPDPCPPAGRSPRIRVIVPPPEVVYRRVPAADCGPARPPAGGPTPPAGPAMVNVSATYTVPYVYTTMVPVPTSGFAVAGLNGGFGLAPAAGGFNLPTGGGTPAGFAGGSAADLDALLLRALLARANGGGSNAALQVPTDPESRLRAVEQEVAALKTKLTAEIAERKEVDRELIDIIKQVDAKIAPLQAELVRLRQQVKDGPKPDVTLPIPPLPKSPADGN